MINNFTPLISVIIPAFNVEKFIEETICSVLNQTYQNFEIIVVDDSSLDGTLEIVKKLSETDSRILFYKIDHAGKPSVPRNYGIKKANGEFVAFLDSDDIWLKDKLEMQLKYFQRYPEAVFVYTMSVTFGNVNIFSSGYEVLPLLFNAAHSREDLIKKGNSITCSSVLAKSKIVKDIGGFDEDPKLVVEDYDLWLRLSERGSFYFIPRIYVKYRVHKTQVSGDWETKQKRLEYLAIKRGLKLPPYRFRRNKGLLFLLPRNFIHLLNFIWVKFLSLIR